MKRIPIDIIINHIIPYTYNIQPNLLLEDIKNYHKIKTILTDDKYDIDIIHLFTFQTPTFTNYMNEIIKFFFYFFV